MRQQLWLNFSERWNKVSWMWRLSKDNLFAGGLSSIFLLTFKSQEQVKEAKLKQLGGEVVRNQLLRGLIDLLDQSPPGGQEDSKRTPRPRERRSRTQGTHMHYRPRYAKATASCWKSVKWYSAQKNRDNIRDNILHRRIVTIGVLGDNEDTQSEQNLPRGPRGQVSHNDPVVGSSIAAIRNSEEEKMWMLRSYQVIKFHLAREPESRESLSLQAFANSTCGACFTFGLG